MTSRPSARRSRRKKSAPTIPGGLRGGQMARHDIAILAVIAHIAPFVALHQQLDRRQTGNGADDLGRAVRE